MDKVTRDSRLIRAAALAIASVLAAACSNAPGAPTDGGTTQGDGGSGGPADGASGGGILPLNCVATANRANPRCGRPSSLPHGSIGTGFAPATTPGFPEINGGFVDGTRLIVGVTTGMQATGHGVVMAVDLATGNRSVVSGFYDDAAQGGRHVGTGPDPGFVYDVQPGTDGWYATCDAGVIRIDPTTGNRTMVWETTGMNARCTLSTGALTRPSLQSLALGPDNTVYLSAGSNPPGTGNGILALRGGGARCEVVSLTGTLPENMAANRGMGPTFDAALSGIRFHDGAIWGLHGLTKSLIRIDPASGDRTRVSSSNTGTMVGGGDAVLGSRWVAFGANNTIWTSGPFAQTGPGSGSWLLTAVDPATGNRTGYDAGETYGPVAASSNGSGLPVWPHPSQPLIIVTMDTSILLFDPATGNSNILSH